MELIKVTKKELSPLAHEILKDLQETMKEKEVLVEKSFPKDGGFVIKPVKAKRKSYNLAVNESAPPELWGVFFGLVKESNKGRLQALIQSDQFSLVKAIQALNNSPIVANDPNLIPETWEDCQKYNTSTLASLRKYHGEETAVAILFLALSRFVNSYTKRADLTDKNIQELVQAIMNKYYYITVAEFRMILEREIREGQNHFNMDKARFLKLFQGWIDRRAEFYEEQAHNRHQGEKGAPDLNTGNYFGMNRSQVIKGRQEASRRKIAKR